MKTAWLLHGTGGNDQDYFWFEDTALYLKAEGYDVWWPQLPNSEKPNIEETTRFIQEAEAFSKITNNTVLIGHSSACPVILKLLENVATTLKQVVLVSGFYTSLDDDGYSDLMLPDSFDWDQIKSKSNEFIFINSDNDPWGCDDIQARPIALQLQAKLIMAAGQGHMGSGAYSQPYKEFPLLKRLLCK